MDFILSYVCNQFNLVWTIQTIACVCRKQFSQLNSATIITLYVVTISSVNLLGSQLFQYSLGKYLQEILKPNMLAFKTVNSLKKKKSIVYKLAYKGENLVMIYLFFVIVILFIRTYQNQFSNLFCYIFKNCCDLHCSFFFQFIFWNSYGYFLRKAVACVIWFQVGGISFVIL